MSVATISKVIVTKLTPEKEKEVVVKEEKEKVNPAEIPLPDLSDKKEDETSEAKLQKLKEKKRRTDVGETVAKLVESLPDIPLPFSEGDSKTISSDSLPTGSPKEAPKETDSGFIGPKMPAPPPPPPHMGFGPNHGPPGPPRQYGPGQWDDWGYPNHWDYWEGPGPRPPYRMRHPGPYDPRMFGPRMRPPFMNRPRGPPPYGMGHRYPGPHGHYDYDGAYEEEEHVSESKSPPPLPKDPPKSSSPKPPLPKKKKEPEQNPDIVIPPEQAEMYRHLQKQAAKHARRQLRKQARKEAGEPEEDSSSSESEPEEQPAQEVLVEEGLLDETQGQVLMPQMVLAQPQPTGSPSAAYIVVSGGQQYIVHRPMAAVSLPMQAGQPMIATSQGAIMATAQAAASGALPAHVVHHMPSAGMGGMMAMHGGGMVLTSAGQLQHLQQLHLQQQIQQAQQIQQIQQIQAHNQAVAMAAAQQPILFGNQILVPRIGVRPAI